MTPAFVVISGSVVVHILLMWLLVSKDIIGVGVYGGAVAFNISNILNMLLLMGYIRYVVFVFVCVYVYACMCVCVHVY